MIGIAWGVITFLITGMGIGLYLSLAYQEGEEDYRKNKYDNTRRGLVAKSYDRGWDAAGRERIRLMENVERRRAEDASSR